MSKSTVINKVLITAGTHGNEMSGVEYVRNLQSNEQILANLIPKQSELNIEFTLVNNLAIKNRCRYVEEDLNRQFTLDKLSKPSGENLEHILALEFNARYGPKTKPSTDLLIDIHNTTSNMGPTLIILETDDFHQQMARYVKSHMPEAVILIEDHIPYQEHAYLCTVGKRGVMIEVGPQPQGVLRPAAYLQTEQMTQILVSFCDLWNKSAVPQTDEVEAFRLTKEVKFPVNAEGRKLAMIHPQLQNKDFSVLNNGEPVFQSFEGKTITWDGDDNVYPHFIGESAYYHLDVAFALATKTVI
ncbi:aspartoacylase [Glaciecola sp. MF2-115]|uniref:aspartoacylase n=1 Tax=Glaciecola sp. MF2-115 TaxID=3384827 RepID=UPI0039A31A8F